MYKRHDETGLVSGTLPAETHTSIPTRKAEVDSDPERPRNRDFRPSGAYRRKSVSRKREVNTMKRTYAVSLSVMTEVDRIAPTTPGTVPKKVVSITRARNESAKAESRREKTWYVSNTTMAPANRENTRISASIADKGLTENGGGREGSGHPHTPSLQEFLYTHP